MKTIICGGRDYHLTDADRCQLTKLIKKIPITEVIHGCAPGADTDAGIWAHDHHLPVTAVSPDWRRGRMAGPVRNAKMASLAQACIAFPGGAGTRNMVTTAKQRGLKVCDYRTQAEKEEDSKGNLSL